MYLPKQWLAKEMLVEWYGRRVAGTRWVEFAAGKVKKLGKLGCLRSELAPWLFYHPTWDISLELHMDDIYGCGPPEAVAKFLEELHKEMKIKSEVHMPGGEPFCHLKRKRTLAKDGSMFIQSDGRHLRTIKKVLNLEGAKGSATPAVAGGNNYAQGEVCLSEEDVKKFKTCVWEC